MNLLDMKACTFLEVVKAGSFSKAAKALYVSPVSVMKQMNTLESQVGFPLLERTHAGVSPTPAGRLLARRLSAIAAECEDALVAARKENGDAKRVIRIGTSFLRPCRSLVSLCAQAGLHLPFRIEVVPFDDGRDSLAEVMSGLGGQIDCLMGPFDWRGPGRRGEPGFLKLLDVACCVGVPLGHKLHGRRSLT